MAFSTSKRRASGGTSPPPADAQDRVLEAIKNKLSANGIDLPYPTQRLLLHDQMEATDGHRRQQHEGWPAGPDDVPPARAEVFPPTQAQE